jgi:hypothetical protein
MLVLRTSIGVSKLRLDAVVLTNGTFLNGSDPYWRKDGWAEVAQERKQPQV